MLQFCTIEKVRKGSILRVRIFLSGTVGVGASGAFRLRPQSGAFGPSWGRPALFRPASRVGVRPSAARASSEYGWMRLWGNAKIGCSSMSRCGLVCFGMQVHGSTPGDSQRVEDVAIIDTGLARNPQPGMSQKGGERAYTGCQGRPGVRPDQTFLFMLPGCLRRSR